MTTTAAVVREARLADEPDVAALFHTAGWGHPAFDRWRQQIQDLPVSAGHPQTGFGWALESGGRVVGFLRNVLHPYRYGDRDLIAASASTLIVEPEFRGYALRLVAAFCQQRGAGQVGSFLRREQEWAQQSNAAAGEIDQVLVQLRAAEIREAMAERDYLNHDKLIANAKEIVRFLDDENEPKTAKKTSKGLYAWMKREVRGLYGQCYQLAFDVAKKAERALQHELGNPELTFLGFDYLEGREGCSPARRCYLDIKRMEMAYHENNRREYELTKHVSLMQLDPRALLSCAPPAPARSRSRRSFSTWIAPGITSGASGPLRYHALRGRALCERQLHGHAQPQSCIRKRPEPGDSYPRGDNDERFDGYAGSLQSIVTSGGQNDSGLFEGAARDERYLPFEGAGVIGDWRLELPGDCAVRLRTIADVILHVRYTAREGGAPLRSKAVANLRARMQVAEAIGCYRLLSIRHEFPSAWAVLKSVQSTPANRPRLALRLRDEHYPFWSGGADDKEIKAVYLLAKSKQGLMALADTDATKRAELVRDATYGGLLQVELTDGALKPPQAVGEYAIRLSDNSFDELWLLLNWAKK